MVAQSGCDSDSELDGDDGPGSVIVARAVAEGEGDAAWVGAASATSRITTVQRVMSARRMWEEEEADADPGSTAALDRTADPSSSNSSAFSQRETTRARRGDSNDAARRRPPRSHRCCCY